VVCATKDVTVTGPTSVWSAIALAIPEDRDRDSSLFIEDVGQHIPGGTHAAREGVLQARMEHIVDSVVLCGQDQDVRYREIFIGFKTEWVPEGRVGCALTCAPYVVLARNAVPRRAADLLDMPLSEWEEHALRMLSARGADG
jgi:histidine decarboxylase